jgi:adenine-specific DNA methylase
MSGIPYMGSKRKLACEIVSFLIRENPQARHFFDLFGGGGAVSFEAIRCRRFASVHYNDANTAVVSLLRKLQSDGVTDEMFKWVSREDFFELIKGDDWRAGLAQTCWSFGNRGASYLFGRDIEPIKKAAHELVVMPCEDTANAFKSATGLICPPCIYEARRDWFDSGEHN